MSRAFRVYDVHEIDSIAPIFRTGRCGVYILEFKNGDRYVGQALDVVRRFAQHVHGGKHHDPWPDIVSLQFLEVEAERLSEIEKKTISAQRAQGFRLRNKTWNFDFAGASVLDEWIPPVQQHHWATGGTSFNPSDFASASRREAGGQPRLFSEKRALRPWAFNDASLSFRVADAVLSDISIVLETVPNAVELEGEYWTLSDYPNTARGRFATLNAGGLEFIYFPRIDEENPFIPNGVRTPCSYLNLLPGSLITDDGEWSPHVPDAFFSLIVDAGRSEYPMTTVDQVVVPIGLLWQIMELDYIRKAAQKTALTFMRKGPSSLFKRSHSRELARLAYAEVANAHL